MNKLRPNRGQALAEIAIFGAILIFLIGVIIRSHMNSSFTQNYKVRAVKFALKQSYEGAQGGNKPNIARNFASVIFVEDRLSPDLNKFNTLDRSPFIAQGSATMSNMLQYPVDYSDEYKKNIPIMDLYVNGQHFELTTAAFVYRTLYKDATECEAAAVKSDSAEYDRCKRQVRELDSDGNHTFYSQAVNGTESFDAGCGDDECWDLSRSGDKQKLIPLAGGLRQYMTWQWQREKGLGSKMDFGSVDEPKYPLFDTSGSLREQTIYYISDSKVEGDKDCWINGNDHLISIVECGGDLDKFTRDPRENKVDGKIEAVGVMDYQLGDFDSGYDRTLTPRYPQPGPTQDVKMYTNIKRDKVSFLEIKEGKLYSATGMVRSVTNKDKVDLISRTIQLSNDTGNLCQDHFKSGTDNPVHHCVDVAGECMTGVNFTLTCFDRKSRKLYVRSNLMDRGIRKWFTDVTQGL